MQPTEAEFEEFDSFTKKIGLDFPGEVRNGKYIIPLMGSDEYSKVYTILDKSDLVELTEPTLVTMKASELNYVGEGMEVSLTADFTDDLYRVVITKQGDTDGEEEIRFSSGD